MIFTRARGRRAQIRSDESMEDSVQYRVQGWQNASESALIAFLERKASSPSRPPLKVLDHTRDGDSVIITVSAKVAPRFAHLDGFTFAGSKLCIKEVSGSAPPRQEPAKTSIPIQPARFRDEADIGANFVTTFFPQYDSNRQLILQNFYDTNSNFSLSVNTRANRVESSEKLDHSWSAYIKESRNLTKITHLPARMSRSHRGQEAIFKKWSSLPTTRHPPFDSASNQNWLIECHSMPGLPDPTGAAPGGVGGLIVIVHGSFEELGAGGAQVTSRRSFDRTFIIGPGAGLGGIRVISDILSLRAYGGHEGIAEITQPTPTNPQQPQAPSLPQQPPIPPPQQLPPAQQQPQHPEVPAGSGFGAPQPGKTQTMLSHEVMTLQLSFQTRLKLQWAAEALEKNGWNLDAAGADVQKLAGQIPPEAFLQI
jgi:hypothetical protein